MSYNTNKGTGGASIIPSARQSIHNHWCCPFASDYNMARYGLDRDRDNRERSCESAGQEGTDEVDNIISKPIYPIRSMSTQNINIPRRNSLRTDNQKSTTDSETNVLSKSVPATLPSQLYCSDDSEDELAPRNKYQFGDVSSYHSVGTPNSSNNMSWSNVNRSTNSLTTPKVLESARTFTQRDEPPTQNNSSKLTIFSLIGVVVTVCASMLSTANLSNVSTYNKFTFYTDISGLGEKYNVDENSILQLQTGISTIFERRDTGSFIFVYNSDAPNFNPSEFNKFVSDVSFAASKYLRNESTPLHYTMVEGTKLDMEEHSELVSRYRQDLDRTGVMLVRHIEAIPSDLAMAFHYYCDEYNPLVKKSAIFFTLNLAKCPNNTDNKSFHSLIEKCLTKKWCSIPRDNIGPLLTRVVNIVIDVTSVF